MIQGFIHAVPGVHPTSGIYHRPPMVPITDVAISYSVTGRPIVEHLEAIDVNREALSSLSLMKDEVTARLGATRSTSSALAGSELDRSSAVALPILEPSRRAPAVLVDQTRKTPTYLPTPRYSRPTDR